MPAVAQKTVSNQRVVNRVRDLLRTQEYRPFELMAYLETDFDDALVREALWNLLGRLEIEFTREQKLRLRDTAQGTKR